MTDTAYKNVLDMARGITGDGDFVDAVQDALKRQQVIRQLMAARAACNKSQAEIAEAMGCSQSRISKMENAADEEIQLGDLMRYAEVVNRKIAVAVVRQNLKPVDKVKICAMQIQREMDRMTQLAKSDPEIGDAVVSFFSELCMNMGFILADIGAKLPQRPDGKKHFELMVGETDCESPEDPKDEHEPSLM